MNSRCVATGVALAGVIGCLALSAPAWGEPADETQSSTLSLSDLGSSSALEFYGVQDTRQLTLPVPSGLTPATLNATVELPVNPQPGTVTVTQDERTIARMALPPADQAPIVIPLAGAKVLNNWMTLTVRAYLSPEGGYCLDPTSPLRLVDGTVTYTGPERAPATVADFLPPVLRKLTIFLPSSPSKAESDAAVHLAAAVASRYGKQTPEIAAFPLAGGEVAPPTPSPPMERQIVVKEGPDSGLSLQGAGDAPWLLVSGPAGELTNQTRLLSSDLSPLAMSSKALVGLPNVGPQLPGDTTTLRDLGQPGAKAVALAPQVSIGLDQTRFGRAVHDVRVHLKGSYSPVPADAGGQIVAMVGGETIDSWPTDGKGVIDRSVTIPDRLLARTTNLQVLLTVSDNTGRCGDFHTPGAGDQLFSLTINGDSTVQSSRAEPPAPGGLQSMPQALTHRVHLGIGADALGDTQRAIALVTSLQRVSALPMDTSVMSVQEAIDSSDPAVLISADGWNNPDISLPVSAPPDGPITVNAVSSDGKPATLALDPALKFASLQTVYDGKRSLLVATSNGAPAQLDELVRWLNGDKGRWTGLSGTAVVSAPGRDPVIVNTTAAAPVETAGGSPEPGWIWWVGGGVLAVAAVGVAALFFRGRPGSQGG
ncbi:MAG: hypothetical protein WAM92_16515 [Mycobacterium sp.]